MGTDTVADLVPRLAPGVELIGQYQGSGFQEPHYLVRRADGQVIQLSQLLYWLAAALDGHRDLPRVAGVLSGQVGKLVTTQQVSYLITNRLRPAGLVADPADERTDTTAQPVTMTVKPDPLLALKCRVAVIPQRSVWRIAGIFGPLFQFPVIATALATFAAFDVVIVAHGGLGRIVPSALALVYQPALTLLVMAMVCLAAAFHECGHVSACRYGGATPGPMGIGLYLIWPAFYSTVTDSYRLSRIGRLRTDLGGVYFNAVFLTGMSLAYLSTGSPWLLVAIVALHLETATQFLPMVRLDGYYILSDLIGVPDLFSRMGPVLASMIPGRATHPRVRELKAWARRAITIWVALVVPSLVYWVIGFVIVVPRVLPVVWTRLVESSHTVSAAAAAGNIAQATVNVVDIILLVLPWAGSLLLLIMIVRWSVTATLTRFSPSHFPRGALTDRPPSTLSTGCATNSPR